MIKKYLITSEPSSSLKSKFVKFKPNFALYRDKSNKNYEKEAKKFLQLCKEFKDIKTFLHTDVEMAFKLDANGVHLTSLGFKDIEKAKKLGLEVIISTHTKEEVLKAQKLGADYVTYSPIFFSPNKAKAKGINDLKELLQICKIKVFALGGIIKKEEVDEIAKTDVYGFASIRYFE